MPVSELAKVGLDVGSDVPFCVYGGACVVEGRGEQVGPSDRSVSLLDCPV